MWSQLIRKRQILPGLICLGYKAFLQRRNLVQWNEKKTTSLSNRIYIEKNIYLWLISTFVNSSYRYSAVHVSWNPVMQNRQYSISRSNFFFESMKIKHLSHKFSPQYNRSNTSILVLLSCLYYILQFHLDYIELKTIADNF